MQVEFARLGAIARLQQIDKERASILASFPELKKKGAMSALGIGIPGPRRKVSAAARRAMSEGMRRFWAKRKGQMKHHA
jgi:hypothetical protein